MDWSSCSTNGIATLQCIPLLINNLIRWALAVAGITAVVFIILGGFKYINSGGDPKQADEARKTITYAIIGLVVIFISFFLVNFVGTVTGVSLLGN